MSKVLQISEDYLEELISQVSKRLVGKIMKRHDLFGSDKNLKSVNKELIYEGFRELRDLLIAHHSGLDISVFEFKTKERDVPTQK